MLPFILKIMIRREVNSPLEINQSSSFGVCVLLSVSYITANLYCIFASLRQMQYRFAVQFGTLSTEVQPRNIEDLPLTVPLDRLVSLSACNSSKKVLPVKLPSLLKSKKVIAITSKVNFQYLQYYGKHDIQFLIICTAMNG